MKFQFNTTLSEKDYLDFNIFSMTKSPFGKKQIRIYRILFCVIVGGCILFSLFINNFSSDAMITAIPMLILLALAQMILGRAIVWTTKWQFKLLKKSGNVTLYPNTVIEFYEDRIAETTPDNKIEHKYSAIDRISVVDNKMVYIHIGNFMAFLLPFSSFESKSQQDEFFAFIRTICEKIDIY